MMPNQIEDKNDGKGQLCNFATMPVLETLMEMAISTYMHVTFLILMMV